MYLELENNQSWYDANCQNDATKAYPCRENSISITKLEEAIHWQEARTRDREQRKVEGTNND